ncbi:MAG: hypothetical protein ACFFB5_24750 [Promethearchaeota archaeon]
MICKTNRQYKWIRRFYTLWIWILGLYFIVFGIDILFNQNPQSIPKVVINLFMFVLFRNGKQQVHPPISLEKKNSY